MYRLTQLPFRIVLLPWKFGVFSSKKKQILHHLVVHTPRFKKQWASTKRFALGANIGRVQLIPGLGKLLETTPHEAVRNNIVCILCDWVVRYGTAVDPVMSQVDVFCLLSSMAMRECLSQRAYNRNAIKVF